VRTFKVQFKFDIPLFEGYIDFDSLEKWLSMLEGYFSLQNFSNSENITFVLCNTFPMSEIGGKITVSNMSEVSMKFLGHNPLGRIFLIPSRINTTLLETTMTNTRDGKIYVRRETKRCESTPTYSIPCAQILVLNTLSDIYF
jgi:hypothetical protein